MSRSYRPSRLKPRTSHTAAAAAVPCRRPPNTRRLLPTPTTAAAAAPGEGGSVSDTGAGSPLELSLEEAAVYEALAAEKSECGLTRLYAHVCVGSSIGG